ncbi:MAG TPA: hypothetical protein VKT76_06040 [Bradyrhizobium sp.]|nr:hypothetical protein [Bradyrhizobium sp.]
MSRILKTASLKASLIVLGALVLAGPAMADELDNLIQQAESLVPVGTTTYYSGNVPISLQQKEADEAVKKATDEVAEAKTLKQTEDAATDLAKANAQLTAANQAAALVTQGRDNMAAATATNLQMAKQAFAADQNLSPNDPKYQHDQQALALASMEATIAANANGQTLATMDQLKAHAELALALQQLQTLVKQQPPATPDQIAQANAAINQWKAAVGQADQAAANIPTATKVADSALAVGAAQANLAAANAAEDVARSRKIGEARKTDERKIEPEGDARLKASREKEGAENRKREVRLDKDKAEPRERRLSKVQESKLAPARTRAPNAEPITAPHPTLANAPPPATVHRP